MGAYQSAPITDKVSSDQRGRNLAYGASSMQGWRMSQEDAHNCCIDFDEDVALFAVYDGHGGHDVATYCSQHLPEYIKNTEAYKKGDIKQALIDAFLGFDATLATPKVVNILKEIAGTKTDHVKGKSDDSDVEENVDKLYMEASMPLEQVIAKYQTEIRSRIYNPGNENVADQVHPLSSFMSNQRIRDRGACSSSGAGCSTSSTSWDTNETDVSSSSQHCSSSSSSTNRNVETPNSSEADQILDSTTSNGDVPRSSQVGSSADSEPAKISEMPDSSEDINETVTPSKVTNSISSPNEAEINGENTTKNFEAADSSKNVNDNECSSSCTPVENGEAEQQERISSSGRRKQLSKMYATLLKMDEENSDDDDEDDDDEEADETFDGQRESDDEDDVYVDNEDSGDDTEEDDEDDDENDDNDEDDDDDDDNASIEINDKPGVDSGCTAVVAVLKGNELYVANAGDSRCVLCRNGEAVELSFDHKPEDQPEKDRIVKAGGKVTGDGRVNGGLNLSRALGDHAYKQNKDLPPEEQMISALPDIKTVTLDLEKDEFMVLACDGIWNSMSSQSVIDFVRTRLQQGYENLSKICEELFDHCLAPNTFGDGTGCDNMTAIIVKFKPSQMEKEASSTEEVTSVTKKRPVSPNASNEENECTTGDNVVENSKRMKTETC